MTRTRAASALGPTPTPVPRSSDRSQSLGEVMSNGSGHSPEAAGGNGAGKEKEPLPTIRFIPHVEPRSSRPSLQFTAVSRTLKQSNNVVKVGRYSERDNAVPTDPGSVTPVGFKSKVVSRRHCEFWCTEGQWYVKDVCSSSGTFLNHVRLSSPGEQSRPYPVNDGDVVQLGIDFKGGEEIIFRCVKIRIECNRGWQKSLNSFNTSAHKRLLKNAGVKSKSRDSDAASTNSSECSICLNPVAPCQALFVAPCSHVWHYKCVRNLIHGPSWPNFLCPNCRFVADLDAEVEQPEEDMIEEEQEDGDGDDIEDPQGVLEDTHNHTERPKGTSEHRDTSHRNATPGQRSTNISDEELAVLMGASSLHPPAGESSEDTAFQGSESSSRPVTITASSLHQRTPSSDLLAARSATPTSNTQFALAAGVMNMPDNGPSTPRNDAGPFVLDGTMGRGIAEQALPELSEPGSSPGSG